MPPTVVEHLGVPDAVKLADLRDTIERAHWNQSLHRLQLQASCQHEAVWEALCEHTGQVDALLGAMPGLISDHRTLTPLRKLPARASADETEPDEGPDEMPLFTTPPMRFRLNDSRIQELLMGEQLYGDPGLAIRELYQNALDACRYRKACHDYKAKRDRLATDWSNWIGKIDFDQGADPVTGRAYLECRDNGIGMGEEELRSVFSVAGARFADRTEFHEEQAEWDKHGVSFHPNSRFGIGVMSYFMIADEIVVTTCRMGRDSYLAGESFQVTIAGPGHLFRIKPPSRPRDTPGTTVRLYLRDRMTAPSCVDVLRRVLGIAEFHTVATHDGRPESWKPFTLTPRERPAWEQHGINAHGDLVACPPQEGGHVIWCEHGGALLVDGLYMRPDIHRGVLAAPTETGEPHGAVINLTHARNPRPSVDRTRVLEDVSQHVAELLAEATDELFRANPIFLRAGWLSELARTSPGIADLVTRAAVKRQIRLRFGRRIIDVARSGWFPPDMTFLQRNREESRAWRPRSREDPISVPQHDFYGLPDHIVLWRTLVHDDDGVLGDLAAAVPEIRSARAVLPAVPSDAALVADFRSWSRDGALGFDAPPPPGHLLGTAAATGMSPRAVAQRAAILGATGVRVAQFSDDAYPDTSDLALLSQEIDGRGPWLIPDEPVPLGHILQVHRRLKISCRDAVERLKHFGFDVPHADRLADHAQRSTWS